MELLWEKPVNLHKLKLPPEYKQFVIVSDNLVDAARIIYHEIYGDSVEVVPWSSTLLPEFAPAKACDGG